MAQLGDLASISTYEVIKELRVGIERVGESLAERTHATQRNNGTKPARKGGPARHSQLEYSTAAAVSLDKVHAWIRNWYAD